MPIPENFIPDTINGNFNQLNIYEYRKQSILNVEQNTYKDSIVKIIIYIINYNNSGLKCKERFLDREVNIISEHEYIYDEKERLICTKSIDNEEQIHYDDEKRTCIKYKYHKKCSIDDDNSFEFSLFDSSNNIIEGAYLTNNSKIISGGSFSYDSLGNIIEACRLYFPNPSSMHFIYKNTYDENGRLINYKEFDQLKEYEHPIKEVDYEYDVSGRLFNFQISYFNGQPTKYCYKYDLYNNIKEICLYLDNDFKRVEYIYEYSK